MVNNSQAKYSLFFLGLEMLQENFNTLGRVDYCSYI